MSIKLIISGGGTAGHVLPGISLAEELHSKDSLIDILFIGASHGQEAVLVPQKGFKIELVDIESFQRKLSFNNLKSLQQMYKAYKFCLNIIDRFEPDVIVGMGGYISVPIVMAARRRLKKIILHEQNLYPGLANRFLYRFADSIAVSYTSSLSYFAKKSNVIITGNPIRPEIVKTSRTEGLLQFKLAQDKRTILVFGGSQGARSINRVMLKIYPLMKARKDLQIIHLTGKMDHDKVLEALNKIRKDADDLNYVCLPYTQKMSAALAAADLVVARAGATSIAEITARGLPAIFIPYPFATDDHQRKNAELLVKDGAALMILDKELDGKILFEKIFSLIDNKGLLKSIASKAKKIGKPDAGKLLAEAVLKQVDRFD